MYTLLQNKNQALRKSLLAFARTLVQTPSQSRREGDVANRVEREMKQIGYEQVLQDQDGNVVGLMPGREDEPTVLLNCHMDTVPPGATSMWERNPTSGRMEQGVLHGLGAADCKGGLAAQIYAGALLKRSLLPLKGHLVVAATVAEENGCSIGVRSLMTETLPELGLKPDFAILGEPTDLGIYYGHDGWTELEIRVEGANPFHVRDATGAIHRGFSARQKAARAEQPSEFLSTERPLFQEADGTCRALIPVERRLSENEPPSSVVAQIKEEASLLARQSGNVAVDVAIYEEEEQLGTGRVTRVQRITNAWSVDPFHPLVLRARQALSAAGCAVRAGRWTLGRLGMGTAGSALVDTFDVPTVGYGPGHEEQAHAVNESVATHKIVEATYGTAAIVHSLVGVPVYGWTADEL